MEEEMIWVVRAGEGGYLVDDFTGKNIIAIGWNETGDLSMVQDKEGIKEKLRRGYPDGTDGWVNTCAGMIARFRFEMKQGDDVITYDPYFRIYHVGQIKSGYYYDEKKSEYFHLRDVMWTSEVNRDDLSTETRNSLGSTLTLFGIYDDSAKEIRGLLKGKKVIEESITETEESLSLIKEDVITKAHEFIKDKLSGLNWEQMQELVAGIIRAMGYKTRISPIGPDRGKDITGSPDGLGLEEPRIFVEVKHREGPIGAQEVRSFIGGMRSTARCLYVSTGGFTKDARYEADRSNVPVTLLDSDALADLITEYYDQFDAETRTIIVLKKIYWPK